MFSTLPLKKAYDVINHRSMKFHFKNIPKMFLEKNIRSAVEIHMYNLERVRKELQVKFDPRIKKSSLSVCGDWYE